MKLRHSLAAGAVVLLGLGGVIPAAGATVSPEPEQTPLCAVPGVAESIPECSGEGGPPGGGGGSPEQPS